MRSATTKSGVGGRHYIYCPFNCCGSLLALTFPRGTNSPGFNVSQFITNPLRLTFSLAPLIIIIPITRWPSHAGSSRSRSSAIPMKIPITICATVCCKIDSNLKISHFRFKWWLKSVPNVDRVSFSYINSVPPNGCLFVRSSLRLSKTCKPLNCSTPPPRKATSFTHE